MSLLSNEKISMKYELIFVYFSARKVELNEEELNVIKLDELRHDMSAALDTLKWDYTHTITTRLSPSN